MNSNTIQHDLHDLHDLYDLYDLRHRANAPPAASFSRSGREPVRLVRRSDVEPGCLSSRKRTGTDVRIQAGSSSR